MNAWSQNLLGRIACAELGNAVLVLEHLRKLRQAAKMSLGVGCANTHEHVNRIEILVSKRNGWVKRTIQIPASLTLPSA